MISVEQERSPRGPWPRYHSPAHERATLEACLRQIDFFDAEITALDRALAEAVLGSSEMRRLLTLPGVNAVTAAAVIAAVGDIGRFPTPRHLVSDLGLNPRVQQSGSEPARHGRISKRGPSDARHVLVEAAWRAARETGPLRTFAGRVAARHGSNVAAVAVARKLVVIAWHMLHIDLKGPFFFQARRGPLQSCHFLGLVDDYSRFLRGIRALPTRHAGPILAALEEAIELCGVPLELMRARNADRARGPRSGGSCLGGRAGGRSRRG